MTNVQQPGQILVCPKCRQKTGKLLMDLDEKQPHWDSDMNAQYLCIRAECQCRFAIMLDSQFTNVQPGLVKDHRDSTE